MISYIHGILVAKREDSVIIECQHIGYEIFVPLSVISQLPSIGSEVKMHTELYVREDVLRLYGFISDDDIDVFRKLISVSGIGPKGALGILSTLTPDDLRLAIMTDDSKRISQAKGIGKKTAEKLIIELKDKLKVVDLEVLSASTEQTLHSTYIDEALMGLTGLGYTETEALHAIKHAQHADSTSELIKQALIFLAKE
ncbi:Holliday junction branch migration protein RuvA [Vallitaleaceae bacterium 9-2]